MGKNISISPTYKATSFEERIKPVLLYKEEYNKIQDAYDKILEDTLMLENLKGSEVDSELYGKYSDWRGRVNSAADNLSSSGYLDMQSVRDLRREYINDLKPMEDRYKHKTNLVYKQASEYSPGTIYKRDFSNIAVSDINLDDAIESINLNTDITKPYTDRWSKEFFSSGLPEGDDPKTVAVNNAINELNLEGYNEDAISQVRSALESAYDSAVKTSEQLKREESIHIEQVNAAKGKNKPKPSTESKEETVSWQNTGTGETYKVKKKNGKYYDSDGNEISELDIPRKYSKYLTDPVESAKYAVLENKGAAITNGTTSNFTTVPNDATKDATINKYYGSNNSLEKASPEIVNTIIQAASHLGVKVEGLFAHGYTIEVYTKGQTKYIKLVKSI